MKPFEMFSKNVLYVEVQSLELCEKTERWTESILRKHHSHNDVKNVGQLVEERRKIMDCGMRLIQVRAHFFEIMKLKGRIIDYSDL